MYTTHELNLLLLSFLVVQSWVIPASIIYVYWQLYLALHKVIK